MQKPTKMRLMSLHPRRRLRVRSVRFVIGIISSASAKTKATKERPTWRGSTKHRWHADARLGVRRVGDLKCKERYLQPFRSISREFACNRCEISLRAKNYLPEDCPHEIGE